MVGESHGQRPTLVVNDTKLQAPFKTFYRKTLLNKQTSSNISWVGAIQVFLSLILYILLSLSFDYGYLRVLLVPGALFLSYDDDESKYYLLTSNPRARNSGRIKIWMPLHAGRSGPPNLLLHKKGLGARDSLERKQSG